MTFIGFKNLWTTFVSRHYPSYFSKVQTSLMSVDPHWDSKVFRRILEFWEFRKHQPNWSKRVFTWWLSYFMSVLTIIWSLNMIEDGALTRLMSNTLFFLSCWVTFIDLQTVSVVGVLLSISVYITFDVLTLEYSVVITTLHVYSWVRQHPPSN